MGLEEGDRGIVRGVGQASEWTLKVQALLLVQLSHSCHSSQ